MPGPSFAAVVASLHGHVGKTLLARTLTDYFILSGSMPYVFDTDAVERGLHASFPAEARVIDLAVVRDQMRLFDTLAEPSPKPRIVDVTHRSLITFFELLRGTDVGKRQCFFEESQHVRFLLQHGGWNDRRGSTAASR